MRTQRTSGARRAERGKDGRDGVDGKSVSLDEALAAIGPACQDWTADQIDAWRKAADSAFKKMLGEALAAIPTPVNGKDGAPGADGRSVSLDEIDAIVERRLELKFASYVVEHERRLPDVLQRMIDQIEKPRDGRDGKDGEDGFDLRHFDVEQLDERSFMLRFKDLTREKKHTLVFPVPIQRGIWKAEQPYARGDIVTWGGSQFEKLTDEPGGKPEESPAWRLVRQARPRRKGRPERRERGYRKSGPQRARLDADGQ